MAHVHHNLKIYKTWWHALITVGILLLPVIFILAINRIGGLSVDHLISGLGISLYRLLFSYFLALIFGVALAFFFGTGKLGNFFTPVFDLLQNLPSFALIPVFVLIFGYTNMMVILFAASSILWPILFSVITAIRNAPSDLNDAAAVFGAKGLKKMLHYTMPLSLPGIISGSIIGIGIGWEAVIGIEIIGFKNGIGVFLNESASSGQKSVMLVGIISLLLIVFAINRLVWAPLIRKIHFYGE
jgi:sulfonate transport system permease protein